MRRRKIKEAGLVCLGLGLVLLFMLVADNTTQKYHEYTDRAEQKNIKRLMLYRNLLKRDTLRHEFDSPLDFRELDLRGNTFTMDEEW